MCVGSLWAGASIGCSDRIFEFVLFVKDAKNGGFNGGDGANDGENHDDNGINCGE